MSTIMWCNGLRFEGTYIFEWFWAQVAIAALLRFVAVVDEIVSDAVIADKEWGLDTDPKRLDWIAFCTRSFEQEIGGRFPPWP